MERFFTYSLQDPRVLNILKAALAAVEPAELVRRSIHLIPPTQGFYYALGLGKASQPMVDELSRQLNLKAALIITKHASPSASSINKIIEGGHPIPDARSLLAGKNALEFVSDLHDEDVLICLISGGGSALASVPVLGILLEDLRSLTMQLLKSGASIEEINAIRRKLDKVKGGGLARATKARVVSLILSDVPGNKIETIASGPTMATVTSHPEAVQILSKYKINPASPMRDFLSESESVDRDDLSRRVANHIIGDINLAANAAVLQGEKEGFKSIIVGLDLEGEARQVGEYLASLFKENLISRPRPFCLIAGGETTVTVRGLGKGGRNQELALAAVETLAGFKDILFITLATDGEDGPTLAAGAVVTGDTNQRANEIGMSPTESLENNDSYSYFDKLDDLLIPGPTGTNVNDLVFMVGF